MKSKRMRNIILADIFLLLLLFLASSTDLLIKEKEVEVHKIAVIMDIPVKSQADNFRSGTLEASSEFHMDMNYFNLSSWNELKDKQAVLQKELDNGCKGVILHCEDKQVTQTLLESIPAGIPVLLYNEEAEEPCVSGYIGSDPKEECRLLQEAILQDKNIAEGIVLLERVSCEERVLDLHDRLQEQLEAEGLLVRRIQVDSLAEVQPLVKNVSALLGRVFVSGDISVLQMMGEGNKGSGNVLSVYGIGFHSGIRSLVEEGWISGTVVHRAYEAGYFSVERMVEILNGKSDAERKMIVESVLVTQKNMYSPEIESIVFPYV